MLGVTYMVHRFKQIKNPIVFAKLMDIISGILPREADEEDIVSIIFCLMSMYVHDSDLAEYILSMCAENVVEFYDKMHIGGDVKCITTVFKEQ